MRWLTTRLPIIFRDFGPQTFSELIAKFSGKPFVVSLWSVDCAPCRVELDMPGQMKKADPSFPLVVISTDSLEKREDTADILDEYQFGDEVTWMFADSFVKRLRFSFDLAGTVNYSAAIFTMRNTI